MKRSYAKILFGLVFSIAVLVAGAAQADDTDRSKTVDGLLVYYGVVPAAALQSFPEDSQEGAAHMVIPKGRNVYHLVVAVYQRDGMKRIGDALVTARVREPGFGWTSKHLEATMLSDDTTFCNYFTFHDGIEYQLDIDVQQPGIPGILTAAFHYSNQ